MKPTPPPVTYDDNAVNVFADGSSYSGPRRGGAGFLIVTVDDDGHEVTHHEVVQGFEGATNNQMELKACIEALRLIGGRRSPVNLALFDKVVVYTDSNYVAGNFYSARHVWPRERWMTRDGNPVLNAQLWKELVNAAHKVGKRVEINWRKGHSSSNPHNKTADRLAKESAKGTLRPPLTVSRVRRKRTEKLTERGSVKAEGQLITIRVIDEEWLNTQRMHRYRIEVLSQRSAYFGNVDIYFAEQHMLLKAGHDYVVRLNDDPRSPRIVENRGEVPRGDAAATGRRDSPHDGDEP